jgi:type IV pilus assembly protein PilE
MRLSEVRGRSVGGFTLIELMIVIVIVAVLVGIALPAYRDQIIRGHRASAKAEMLEIANRQEQYLLSNRIYAIGLSTIAYTTPPDVAAKFTFSLSSVNNSGSPYFEVRADAIGSQASDGYLTLDSLGVKGPTGAEDKWKR